MASRACFSSISSIPIAIPLQFLHGFFGQFPEPCDGQLIRFSILVFSDEEVKPCKKQSFGHDSFVCVCSSDYCDSPEPLGDVSGDKMVYYVSDKLAHRLAKFENAENKNEGASDDDTEFEVRVDASKKRQRILGFGGAFTDAAGVNLNALSERSREALLKTYFDKEIGIGYSIGRVPIASSDFSTREYSYLDTPDDFNLTTFALAREDFEDKIPHIMKAIQLTGGDLRLFASPWSPPGWMKTNGRMNGHGQLKGTVDDGPYYRTYGQYFKRFFEEYAKQNVTFWALTIQNEPYALHVINCSWQSLWLPSKMQSEFATKILSPILKKSAQTKEIKIIAHDDQRDNLIAAANELFVDQNALDSIDGLGVHWYKHSPYDPLTSTHNLFPDKFILATESCHGDAPWEHKPLLGDWFRGWAYGHDILNNLRNWVVGWTDWNLCLDLKGGPNWVGNLVDAPLIVNATSDQFYKQPMFYFLAHFSHFVPRNSSVLSSLLFAANGTQLEDRPIENIHSYRDFVLLNGTTIGYQEQIEHVAFETNDGNRVLVLINPKANPIKVSVVDGQQRWTIPMSAESIVSAIWEAK
ncbi:hypothetical protein niasHT_024446 [Heterodera trifolii]|uniref:Glucosylceramidase n=1 Tax=Heterodera trifolii TaxID=157864 RepID=A0ABD2JYM4_9BILA